MAPVLKRCRLEGVLAGFAIPSEVLVVATGRRAFGLSRTLRNCLLEDHACFVLAGIRPRTAAASFVLHGLPGCFRNGDAVTPRTRLMLRCLGSTEVIPSPLSCP